MKQGDCDTYIYPPHPAPKPYPASHTLTQVNGEYERRSGQVIPEGFAATCHAMSWSPQQMWTVLLFENPNPKLQTLKPTVFDFEG
jgi:hypothetical protein